MKYVQMWAENGYCGCNAEQYLEYEDNTTDKEIDIDCDEMIAKNAEDFAYVATGWNNGFEDEQAEADYYVDCTGGWEYVSKKEYLENA